MNKNRLNTLNFRFIILIFRSNLTFITYKHFLQISQYSLMSRYSTNTWESMNNSSPCIHLFIHFHSTLKSIKITVLTDKEASENALAANNYD
ncbi:unnamed protein product [Heterobilharzia americana]|nr:unnamed protein product [Heterobilharzia americana]CAH8574484.1 unnamed protein product [Heterobilharzia americana]